MPESPAADSVRAADPGGPAGAPPLRRRDPALALPLAQAAGWTTADVRAVDTARVLAADAVQHKGNGHPGTAMSLAPLAYLLHQQVMRHDPADPEWIGRDRLVLSCGHASLLLYIQLYFSGYGLELDDLRALRTWGSATPGHPELRHTPGVEVTTGPLGQGFANAVGMAMAARRVRGLLDPEPPAGASPFDHFVYVIASDGDLMEGVCAEASSLAGHQELGNLIAFYDQNGISIDGSTQTALSEDVPARYRAYGWHVQTVDFTATGQYVEDVDTLLAAIAAAQGESTRPSLIVLRTVIGWPAPGLSGTGRAHGSALGEDEVAAVKKLLGFAPGEAFAVEPEILEHVRLVRDRGTRARVHWMSDYARWKTADPQRAALLGRLRAGRLPLDWHDALPVFDPGDGPIATREASGAVLAAVADRLPELWGGSADLASSTSTTMPAEASFLPESRMPRGWPGDPYGRTVHFGVREHAMGAIMNGIAAHGLTRPYGSTFLAFSDYMRPTVRLAAMAGLPVVYLWTHDSVGLGEDGPTHQPVEHLAALRAIPGLAVVRPADANETVACWRAAVERTDGPVALALSRQELPVLDRGRGPAACSLASEAAYGGYILRDAPEPLPHEPEVLLIATGSEVALALDAQDMLARDGVAARVVSMPCREWFDEQRCDYRDMVLPPQVRARVAVEAGVAMPWRDLVGDAGRVVGLRDFGASAEHQVLYRKFGLTAEAVAHAARQSLAQLAGLASG
ncbi:transketolase [Yinghuangia soli]|uniref:Transketolase n=1 Tax=Yinghuangia soli TaxID=2908204 RepID=A0AA41U2S5_9ACTN|nr:transketolase [Yinghuangia soli]MCF2532078.1 transketolase [Yinghuangia soli]